MKTYYVKRNEIYTVTTTVECEVYDANGELVTTLPANQRTNIQAETNKLSLSDDNAALKKTASDSGSIAEEVTEHIDNEDIHITTGDRSKISGAAQLSANNTFTGSNTFTGGNTFNQLTTFKSGIRSTYNANFDNYITVNAGINVLPLGVKTPLGADAFGLSVSASGGLQLFGTHFLKGDIFTDESLKVTSNNLSLYSTDSATISFDYANKSIFRSMPNDGTEGTYEFQCWQWTDDSHTSKKQAGVKLIKASQVSPLQDDSVLNKAEADSLYAGLVGEVRWYAGSTIPDGWLMCDGTAVSRTTYAKLFSAIGTAWGAGNGSSTFNLPNLIDKVAWGSIQSGEYLEAGLPNITGSLVITDENSEPAYLVVNTATGAFDKAKQSGELNLGFFEYGHPQTGRYTKTTFDASRSSAIYGKSSTVQPPAAKLMPIIKY